MSREQRGYLFHKGTSWFLRYSDNVRQPDGSIKWQQVCKKLAVPYGDRYRSKASVRQFVADVLGPVNGGQLSPNSTMPVVEFVDQVWMPYIAGQVRAYTLKNYKHLWARHLRDRIGKVTLRDCRTKHIVDLLGDVARPSEFSKSTLQHLKNLLSAIFRDAKQLGYLDSINPVLGVKLPRTVREMEDTYAYSLAELQTMLLVLGEPARTVVLCAGLTGLRKSELTGLRVADYTGKELLVSRSIVNGDTNETKSKSSRAPVPVIESLADALDAHIKRMDVLAKPNAPLFRAGNGAPLNLKNLVSRTIVPALVGTGVIWRGWHAFRRGLATVLHQAGVPDKDISTICRHSNVAITQGLYIKSVSESQIAAMNVLGDQMKKAAEKTEADRLATVALQLAEKSLECNENGTAKELIN
jgi:integrase